MDLIERSEWYAILSLFRSRSSRILSIYLCTFFYGIEVAFMFTILNYSKMCILMSSNLDH